MPLDRVGAVTQATEAAHIHELTVAMNEALMLGSVRQHELTEAANVLNAKLQDEIKAHKQTAAELHRTQVLLSKHAGELEGLVAERTAELTATNQHLEAFVYSIAHDLRAPLRAVQGFSEVMVEEAGETLNETGRHYAVPSTSPCNSWMRCCVTCLLSVASVSNKFH